MPTKTPKCGCGQPRVANYWVEVIYSTTMDSKDVSYYLCAEHVPCEDSVAEWFPEYAGYAPDEVTEVHETTVKFIR